MIKYLSAIWTAFAPALGDHLWQSTLFAVIAGLLTLVLRKNYARIRYLVWLSGSLKFLVPFLLMVGIGGHLAWPRGSVGTNGGWYFAMEEVTQPFTQPVPSRSITPTITSSLDHLLPALLAVWLCGFLVVLCVWYTRWLKISAAIGKSRPLREGREVEALRRLERIAGTQQRIEIMLSRTSLEPGIFGVIRPIFIWPEGISKHLEDAHLDGILAHELCHVRRRDNLAAAIHMVVEAIFWFHPLVWWLGARLLEERERACDEEVLELGSDRRVYAESILRVSEFCVESPLACVPGVTGADLKKRMVYIMTKSVSSKLDFSRKLLLSAAGLMAVAAPIVVGLARPTQSRAASQAQSTAAIVPTYETISIKPNKTGEPMAPFKITGRPVLGFSLKLGQFLATNATLHQLIRRVYDVQDDQISGGPSWLDSEHYDLQIKMDKSVDDELQKLGPDQRFLEQKRMLQAVLVDRFKLAIHRETKEVPVYALVIGENGLKLQRAIPGDNYPNGLKRSDGVPIGAGDWSQPGKYVGQGVPIAPLVQDLSKHYLHRTVLDKTGLTDKYDFTLQWTPVGSQAAIFTAIQEQLGLKLESQKGPAEILVIDHAEQPSAN